MTERLRRTEDGLRRQAQVAVSQAHVALSQAESVKGVRETIDLTNHLADLMCRQPDFQKALHNSLLSVDDAEFGRRGAAIHSMSVMLNNTVLEAANSRATRASSQSARYSAHANLGTGYTTSTSRSAPTSVASAVPATATFATETGTLPVTTGGASGDDSEIRQLATLRRRLVMSNRGRGGGRRRVTATVSSTSTSSAGLSTADPSTAGAYTIAPNTSLSCDLEAIRAGRVSFYVL